MILTKITYSIIIPLFQQKKVFLKNVYLKVCLSFTQVFAQQQNHPTSPGNLHATSVHEAIVSQKKKVPQTAVLKRMSLNFCSLLP